MVLRKVAVTCKESVVLVIQSALSELGIPYAYNSSNHEIRFPAYNGKMNRIIFTGLDIWQKLKSRKGISGIWCEEMTELTRKEFEEVDLIFREDTGHYHQIMGSFNPDESLGPWIKEDFFDNVAEEKKPLIKLHHSTVLDNPIKYVRENYIKKLEAIKDQTYRTIYLEGEWAVPKGVIFNWDVVVMPDWLGKHVEIFYGGDFGYSIDQATFIKVYRIGNHFWVEEKIYQLGLTNIALGRLALQSEPDCARKPSYWDSSEPKSIEELHQVGLNAKPAWKGKDSVRAGIDFLLEQNIHIIEPSPHIVKERKSYKWLEDKHGEIVKPSEPVDFNNHCMDAVRYAIVTHCRRREGAILITKSNIY